MSVVGKKVFEGRASICWNLEGQAVVMLVHAGDAPRYSQPGCDGSTVLWVAGRSREDDPRAKKISCSKENDAASSSNVGGADSR